MSNVTAIQGCQFLQMLILFRSWSFFVGQVFLLFVITKFFPSFLRFSAKVFVEFVVFAGFVQILDIDQARLGKNTLEWELFLIKVIRILGKSDAIKL